MTQSPQKGFAIAPFIIILAVLAVGGYWYWQKGDKTVTVPSDWKTYRNEQYGFEVRYPKDWNSSEKRNEGIYQFWLSISSPNEEYNLGVRVSNGDPTTGQAFIFEGVKEEVSLSGRNVTAYVWKQGYECYGNDPDINRVGGPCSAFYIPVKNADKWYFIEGSNSIVTVEGNYSQILSTFKFLK